MDHYHPQSNNAINGRTIFLVYKRIQGLGRMCPLNLWNVAYSLSLFLMRPATFPQDPFVMCPLDPLMCPRLGYVRISRIYR